MRRPAAVLTVGKDQGVVVTPPGEGVAVFEASLAVTDLLARHLGLITRLADVCQGFARPGSAGVLFVLVASAITIGKADRHTVLTH